MDRVKHYREIIHRLMEEYQQLYASQPGSRSPDLARRQRVAVDVVLAPKLGGDHELLHPVPPEGVAELSVAELGGDEPLLLLPGHHCPELSVIAKAESSGPAPLSAGGQPPALSPAATVVGAAPGS